MQLNPYFFSRHFEKRKCYCLIPRNSWWGELVFKTGMASKVDETESETTHVYVNCPRCRYKNEMLMYSIWMWWVYEITSLYQWWIKLCTVSSCLVFLLQNNTSWRPQSCQECTCYSDVAICRPTHCPNPQCDFQRVRHFTGGSRFSGCMGTFLHMGNKLYPEYSRWYILAKKQNN